MNICCAYRKSVTADWFLAEQLIITILVHNTNKQTVIINTLLPNVTSGQKLHRHL